MCLKLGTCFFPYDICKVRAYTQIMERLFFTVIHLYIISHTCSHTSIIS